MHTSALVSVKEYLNTSYRPDCDYVDGHVVERNLGELDHSDLQTEIAFFFGCAESGGVSTPSLSRECRCLRRAFAFPTFV